MLIKLDDILHEIKTAKGRGKHSTKVKIMQIEFFEDRKPKMLCKTLGLPSIIETLTKQGYSCSEECTKKQVSVNYKLTGEVSNITTRNLTTRNLIIKW